MRSAETILHSLLRKSRRLIAAPYGKNNAVFASLTNHYIASVFTIRFFYLVSTFICYSQLGAMHKKGLAPGAADWLWPVSWLNLLGDYSVISYLGVVTFFLSLATLLFYKSPLLRAALFAFALQMAAILNSYGAINHGFHLWLWLLFIFIFIPRNISIGSSTAEKYQLLTVVVCAQLFLMLTYTMAGAWKVVYGIESMVAGTPGNFSVSGLAYQLANRSTQTNTSPLLADFFINNPWFSGPLYWALIITQFLSVFIVFRPKLHVIWGIVLVLFHFGTVTTMSISFGNHVLWLALFFILSPFSNQFIKGLK